MQFSWASLLRDVSRIEINGAEKANRFVSSSLFRDKIFPDSNDPFSRISLAEQIKQQIANGQYNEATETWSQLESVISENSNSVDFYNFLRDSDQDPVSTTSVALAMGTSMNRYSRYLSSKASSNGGISELMNGVIRQKLKIIPKDVR